jgi:hypothetical protein
MNWVQDSILDRDDTCWQLLELNKHAEELLEAPPRRTGKTGVAGKIRRETNEHRPGRIPSGRRTQVCPRLGRPAMTSSNNAEMKG